jgi:hypothetical protein
MQPCVHIRTAEVCLFLCGAAFQAAAPISSALFEARKCPILGLGLFRKESYRQPKPLHAERKLSQVPLFATKFPLT